MTRAHLFRPLQDGAGNLQRGATVRLYRPGTTELVASNLYIDETSDQVYTQPITCPTGFLNVYLDRPRRLRVGVTPFGGGTEVFFDDIDSALSIDPASNVPIDPIEGLLALDVQGALQELQATKYGAGAEVPTPTASEVAFTPYGLYLDDTLDVQVALQDVDDALVALDTRTDDVETVNGVQTGRLDGHETRLDEAEIELAGHETRIDALETTDTDYDTRITALENEPDVVGNTFKSTSGAGLPVFAGRTNGDLHYNETTLQEYILQGAASGTLDDNFNRDDAVSLGTSSDGQATWTHAGTGPAISGNKAVKGDTNAAFQVLGTGGQHIHVLWTPTAFNDSVRLYLKNGAYLDLQINGDATEVFYAVYNGASTGSSSFGPNQGIAAPTLGRTYRIDFDVSSTGAITWSYTDTVTSQVYSNTSTLDASLTGGTSAGFRLAGSATNAVDDLSAYAYGTLAWTSTDQYIPPHQHTQVQPFTTKTANYTLTATDGIVFFTGASLTATLPTPVGRAGQQFIVKNLDATNLTVATAAGLIDATATRVLAQYDTLTVVSDGTNWGVL